MEGAISVEGNPGVGVGMGVASTGGNEMGDEHDNRLEGGF